MGIFRSDPQPVQLTPHVPAAALTTGSQPPRTAVAGALAIACVLASWPAQGEPHPIQPMQGRSQIAPLTLVYGQQPPRIDAMPRVQYRSAIVSWPEDKEPRLQFNNQQPERRYIVPLTLVYGQQPPIAGPVSPTNANVAARSWDPPRPEPPLLVKVAPLTLVYGDAPPTIAPLFGTIETFRLAWEPPRREPPPLVKIVPLTLVYGDQPMSDAKRIARHVAWRAWDVPFVSPQQTAGTAAWNVPAIISTVPFFRPAILWTPADWSAQRSSQIAPLTITVVVAQVPFSRPSVPWVALDWSAQRSSQVVPLTLVYGQSPPINGAITPAELNEIVRAWDSTWSAQSQFPNAGWNVPLVIVPPVPFTVQRHMVRHAWEPPFQFPQTLLGSARWNFITTLSRAIALSDGSGAIVGDSKTIAIVLNDGSLAVLGNSGTVTPDSPQNSTDSIKSGE